MSDARCSALHDAVNDETKSAVEELVFRENQPQDNKLEERLSEKINILKLSPDMKFFTRF